MATVKGEKFLLEESTVTQDRIVADKVRELLSPEDLKKVVDTTSFKQMRATRIAGEKPKFKMPNLDNITPAGLADLIGQVREEQKDLKKLEGVYTEALKARMIAEVALSAD